MPVHRTQSFLSLRLPSGVRGHRYLALCLAGGWIPGGWGSFAATAADPPLSWPGKSWEWLADEEAAALGWSREKLEAARECAGNLETDAVMIVVGGKVLDSWGAVESKFNIHSIRKGCLGALCGIQVAAGRLRLEATLAELGVDDNEPSLSEVERRATVRQLLQARSGVYHPALYETARMKAARPPRHSHEPGTFWYYNNWDFNALGTIYEQECGADIYEDFQRLIAEPLGMEDYAADDGKYVAGDDSIHRAYPFRMTARDLARFGLLYLREGRWRDRQVVPADWVGDSLRAYSDAGDRGGYGYLWWIAQNGVHLPGVTLPQGSYSARGSRGHYILVAPPLDLVVVHRVNTDIPGRRVESEEFGGLVRLILDAFEPAVAGPELPVLLPLSMSRRRVPGAAVVTIRDGRIDAEAYYGLREAGRSARVDADTVFEAASMTKPLAAYAALKLAETGLLDLDRPLAAYLPAPYLNDEPLHERIAARMVLSHAGGFPNWRPKGGALKVLHEPGTAYRYSGEGFQFLQRVLEHIAGEDYETMMRRMLLDPLDMKGSSHVWNDTVAATAAAGHDDQGEAKTGRRLYTRPCAAYSLYCTARDYAAFVLEMMKPDRSAPHSLDAESLRQMLTPASPPTGRDLYSRQGSRGRGEVRFGLGWSIEETASGPRFRHSGSNGTGFRSYVEFDPRQGHGLVILTNSTNGDALWKDLLHHIGVP